jgi:LPXTG-site transpeptidase (sortase) family protein
VLCIVAALALGFVGQVAAVGALRHARAQSVEYDDLRGHLAMATAPVGPRDDQGHPLPPGTPIAVLEIPGIVLREVVAEGTSAGVLAAGPGHRRDSVFPGQAGGTVLMGRRSAYGGPFARLGALSRGDRLTVVTGQGRSTYVVLGVRHAGDPQPERPPAGQGWLTLVTADGTPFAPRDVLRVDATLASPVLPSTGIGVGAGSLPAAEAALGGEPGALLPLVLWGQLLVLAAVAVVWIRHQVGIWHAWLVGVPVLTALGLTVADALARLLPNLL